MTATETEQAVQEAGKRAAMAQGLREMADWLEDHPAVPLPYDIRMQVFADIAEIRAGMHLTGPWRKRFIGSYVEYGRSFGEHIRFEVNASRDSVCRKVQVGTKHVEAHDEPVFEWECGPDEPDGTP